MLLIDWARELGLPDPQQFTLGKVLRFVYGEQYLIQLMDGRTYDDRTLDTVLGIMHDEFVAYNNLMILQGRDLDQNPKEGVYPVVELLDISNPMATRSGGIGRRGNVQLCVSPRKGWSSTMPAPHIDAVVEGVRQQVTWYSLTGEWTSFRKDNL